MILACQNINKAFGTDVILKNASFHMEDREKAAVVGINGAGKSTLLKIIIGEMEADSGEVVLAKGKTIGYLAQHQDLNSDHTIYQELLTVKQDVIDLETRIREIEAQMKELSGTALDMALEQYTRMPHTVSTLKSGSGNLSSTILRACSARMTLLSICFF